MPLVINAAISPKADGGKRLSSIDTTIDVWHQRVPRELLGGPIHASARGSPRRAQGCPKGLRSSTSPQSPASRGAFHSRGAAYANLGRRARLRALTPGGWRPTSARIGYPRQRESLRAKIDTAILSPGTSEIVAHQIPMHRPGHPRRGRQESSMCCAPKTSSYVNGAENPHQWRSGTS